jgi:hypothetical protein
MNDKRERGAEGAVTDCRCCCFFSPRPFHFFQSSRDTEKLKTHIDSGRDVGQFFEFLAWFILGKNSLAMKEVSRGMDDLTPEMLHLPPFAPTQLIVHLPQRFYLNNKFNANSKSSPLP